MGDPSYLVSVIKKMAAYRVIIVAAFLFLLPYASGCNMDTVEPIIRCRSNNLEYIVKSMFVLVPDRRASNESDENRTIAIVEPIEVDIFYCEVPDLQNIFARMNSSLERVRVARSNVQLVTINAFEGLESKLRYLDLSGNKLRTVPLAIQNLTRLEVLNLRDNKIQVIAEGPTFANTRHLRELQMGFNSLGYIDASKLQLYPSSPKGNNRKSNQHTPIGLTVFNLGNITSTLEILGLRGNGMHTYPEQLLADFPRLKSLDLSFNSLIDVPEDAFRTMPELQFVNLDSNFIRTIKFSSLPETLKLFTMKNNPMRCDCDVKWILDWIYTNTSLTVFLPKCNAPFHLREISFLRLTGDKLCNQSRINRQTVYVTDRDLSYFPQGVFQSFKLLDVRGEYKSVFVSWKVNPQFYLSQREWLIIYRAFDDSIYRFNGTRFGSRSYIENQTDWTTAERVFSDTIRNLSAGHFYQVCMAVVENNISYVHLNHCRVAQTEKEVVFTLPETSHLGTTTTAAPDPDYLIESNFADIKADARSITVYWSVIVQSRQSRAFYRERQNGNDTQKGDFPPESPLVLNTLTAIYNELKWKITYRKFATEPTTAVTIMKNNYIVTGPNTHQYTIANLKPDTGYSVCFETIDDLPNKGKRLPESSDKADGATPPQYVALDATDVVCKEIVTADEKKFPASEVAIAGTISAAVATIVVSALFCIVPKMFKKKKKKPNPEEDVESAASNVTHADAERDDEEDDDVDSDDDDDSNGKSNGHVPKWKNSHPRITSIFPIDDYRNGTYHGSFRHFNGIPPHPGSQRNGTYPKSILKKSPSAPTLSEALRPIPILKRPSSVTDEQHDGARRDRADPTIDGDAVSRTHGAVELQKIFRNATATDSDTDSEKTSSQ